MSIEPPLTVNRQYITSYGRRWCSVEELSSMELYVITELWYTYSYDYLVVNWVSVTNKIYKLSKH